MSPQDSQLLGLLERARVAKVEEVEDACVVGWWWGRRRRIGGDSLAGGLLLGKAPELLLPSPKNKQGARGVSFLVLSLSPSAYTRTGRSVGTPSSSTAPLAGGGGAGLAAALVERGRAGEGLGAPRFLVLLLLVGFLAIAFLGVPAAAFLTAGALDAMAGRFFAITPRAPCDTRPRETLDRESAPMSR